MENLEENKSPKNSLSTEQIGKIRSDINYFFFNHPQADVKKNLWKLFKGWAYNTADGGGSTEIAPMLLFYEQLLDVLDWLEQLA